MSTSRWTSHAVPDGWADVFVRTVTLVLVAFVTLNLKEWVATRQFDVPACTIDAACIGVATFLFYAIAKVASGGARRTEERLIVTAGR